MGTTACSSTASLPFRDSTLPTDERVEDLLSRMTLEEKVGQLLHQMTGTGSVTTPNPTFGLPPLGSMILDGI